ncbi:uncharacterized protein LOC117297909 [Asterias rubens]|uniref:uncharacterized protein LOC117297909 n=1 Tax=Asterias rubens TaxID=7604 RepID=UPI0014551A5F|nr:uncharacterized protein LOC117297909 [Asterias rubens]
MEFLSKPMSEVWKSTKQTFSEIMDLDDSVIGRRQTPQAGSTANGTGSSPTDAGGTTGSVDHKEGGTHSTGHGSGLSPDMLDAKLTQVQDSTMENHSQVKLPRREKNQSSRNSTSKTKRPVSEDIYNKKMDEETAQSSSTTFNPKQNSRHSLSNPFGKINFRSLNVMNLTKSEPSNKKTNHHSTSTSSKIGASTPTGMVRVSREMKPVIKTSSSLEPPEGGEKSMRKHRTHSHSKSNPGFSEGGLHFRSNSTDRASVMKLREKKGHSYHRSASDEGALSDQGTQRDDGEDSDDLSTEKVKTKFLSMWNNMKYGWTVKTRTAFSLAKPIWIFGKTFMHRPEDLEDERLVPGLDTVKSPAMELFKREFSSLIWLTYRREFPQLAGSSYTTDCGWGCMLRSGQMMLAQALVQHFLGREWNYYNEQTTQEQRFHHEIVRWFGDQPDDMSPFSLHRLVELGRSTGKKAGDWYGPASVAHIFKEAMDKATELNPLLEQVSVYVAQDCTIYKQDVLDLCKRKRPCSLQPVYSDQESTSSSPISPSTLSPNIPNRTPSPTTSFRTPIPQTVEASVNTSTHSAVVHSPMPHSPVNTSIIVNGRTEEVVESHQRNGKRPAHTHTTRNSDVNGTHTKVLDPPPDYPSCCTASNTNQTKRKPTSPPVVSPKPNRHLLRNRNGHEQSPQGGDDTRLNVHQGASHNPTDEVKPSVENTSTSPKVVKPSVDVTRTPPKEVTLRTERSPWCAVVILVPVRLGGDEVNPIYVNSIQKLFTLDCCIGIMGGRPRHSLYYVGFQEEKLIHLDPHYCQPFVDMRTREFSLSSFHCMSPRKMAISKMDPSCTVGFYLRTEEDFHRFCEIIPEIVQSPSLSGTSGDYPMFILRDGKCQDWNSQHAIDTDKPERYLRVRHVDHNGQLIAPVRETEDFVFLDS